MIEPTPFDDDLDPVLHDLLTVAYRTPVGVDTAARHLWVLHQAAARRAARPRHPLRRGLVAACLALLLIAPWPFASPVAHQEVPRVTAVAEAAPQGLSPFLTSSTQLRARALLVYGSRRIEAAERAVTTRPTVVPDLVDTAVVSLERAEWIAGPALVQETLPVRTTMGVRVRELAGSPQLDERGRARLRVFAIRLTGSGEGNELAFAEPSGDVVAPPGPDTGESGRAPAAPSPSDEVPAPSEPEAPPPDEPTAPPAPDAGEGSPAPAPPPEDGPVAPDPNPPPSGGEDGSAADGSDGQEAGDGEAEPAEPDAPDANPSDAVEEPTPAEGGDPADETAPAEAEPQGTSPAEAEPDGGEEPAKSQPAAKGLAQLVS
jgi:hypothetical protein